ncbi:hypothetical protein [Methylobacterium nodulans]|uniref:Uncharacterized protein n=1 Tax=Methylobacterium nodulans (strain LMG 21967 / CNCM I-2342 / ORS 2060) TaxID=460265 RepID=B8IN91_METNO|nr:hypothetical protein [Methylobacterium nodulans]ACL62207.1 hypothetical protein Mnod_7470 [Methylobacterium nodulans ORS 2060]
MAVRLRIGRGAEVMRLPAGPSAALRAEADARADEPAHLSMSSGAAATQVSFD